MDFALRSLSPRDLDANCSVRLVCLPHAGSGAAGFYRWKRLLPPSIAVCPVLLPGRETRLAEPCMRSAAEIVRALHTELEHRLDDKPFALFGHSMGALLAFWWARAWAHPYPQPGEAARSDSSKGKGPVALFVSGRNAPGRAAPRTLLHTLPDAVLIQALQRRYGPGGVALFGDPELRQLFLPIVRADLTVVETCEAEFDEDETPTLRCPVHAFAGVADTSVSEAGLEAWAGTTSGAFTARLLPGDHFFHFAEGEQALLAALAEQLCAVG